MRTWQPAGWGIFAYYAIFPMQRNRDPASFLEGKALLTPVERERFLALVREAGRITNAVNHRKTHLVRILLRSLRDDPLGTPAKVLRGIRRALAKQTAPAS